MGTIYQQSLTCWAWGDPGYCGPQVISRPGGNLNFSFGTSYAYQQNSIDRMLPSGSGLQVNGYNFSFTAKNGNGWDDGRVDQLSALVHFWDTKSNLLYANEYNLNYRFNWTNFNFSETFKTPIPVTSIGSVDYGFLGRDNNGWAGPYGPEVYNVNFSLKYSVDPCASNPMYSPTCPGYMEALAKLLPPAPVVADPVVVQQQTVVAELPPPPPPLAPPPPNQGSVVQLLPPPPPPQQTPSVTVTSVKEEKQSIGTPNLSLALNLIAKNQEKEKAIEQQAVQTAISEAQSATSKAEKETAQVVATLTTMSAASVETGVTLATSSQQSTVSSVSNRSFGSIQLQQNTQSGLGIQLTTNNLFKQNTTLQQSVDQFKSTQQGAQNIEFKPFVPNTPPQVFRIEPSAPVQYQSINNSQKLSEQEPVNIQPSLITDRSNPLREIIESSPISIGEFTEQHRDSSKRVQQVNELATGVDLATLAVVPTGYASYTGFVLKDASFYEPKELYRGQRTVDNVRALRGLGSDKKHQDLVNSQYK